MEPEGWFVLLANGRPHRMANQRMTCRRRSRNPLHSRQGATGMNTGRRSRNRIGHRADRRKQRPDTPNRLRRHIDRTRRSATNLLCTPNRRRNSTCPQSIRSRLLRTHCQHRNRALIYNILDQPVDCKSVRRSPFLGNHRPCIPRNLAPASQRSADLVQSDREWPHSGWSHNNSSNET